MTNSPDNPRRAFFDDLAERWDGFDDQEALAARLDAGLVELGLGPSERVLDLGCGTGNLTRALLARLGPAGRVWAVDLAPRMIARARRKIADPRVEFRVADLEREPLGLAGLDRIVCYSVWPHLEDPARVARTCLGWLRPGGRLHVWHLAPRHKINEIHAGAGPAVAHDVLLPADETAALLAEAGFEVELAREDEDRYLVSARRPPPGGRTP
jgi:demethylmenaquinone methyltransferase/2-methoxy-6-polyprenyl-1,4-benzoquinol methylase